MGMPMPFLLVAKNNKYNRIFKEKKKKKKNPKIVEEKKND